MKVLWCSLMAILILRQTIAGIIRKPPLFSTPIYSNSYLPAAMQVIFHTVEQIKLLEREGTTVESSTIKSSSTTQSMKHEQSQSTIPAATFAIPTAAATTVHSKTTGTFELSSTSFPTSTIGKDLTEAAQQVETTTASDPVSCGHEESSEMNEETVEKNYVTPETNHELPERVQEAQEPNQEIPEMSEEKTSTIENILGDTLEVNGSPVDAAFAQQSMQTPAIKMLDELKKEEPTIDSVVGEIYVIVKPTISPIIDFSNVTNESNDTANISMQKMESIEDEEEETRFSLLGEKVAQVPRPSLNNYLKRTKQPLTHGAQQLANLYDALSKDARKQGFARFAGYSDDVLKVLQSSAEGGVGPQLKTLLEKVTQRNELTRDDAKSRTAEALRDLDNPASTLNKDLRRLLPLRYMA